MVWILRNSLLSILWWPPQNYDFAFLLERNIINWGTFLANKLIILVQGYFVLSLILIHVLDFHFSFHQCTEIVTMIAWLMFLKNLNLLKRRFIINNVSTMNPQYTTELDSFSLFVYFKLIHARRASIFLRFCKDCKKMKFSIKDFFSKCDQIHSLLQI